MQKNSSKGKLLICVECGEVQNECGCSDIIPRRKYRYSSKENIEKFLDDW
jgi:hypothetical protein